ncbi:MAG: hypothetical protein GXO43_03240 [Crenarchaeota archaeon]|nr:hypothetical protein [Thermoproteota archaeon]
MAEPHEHRFAYALWGIAWAIVGIYDALLDDQWCLKFFLSLTTLAIFSLWVGYELAFVKLTNVKKTLIYFVMMMTGINNWNVSWAFNAYLLGWKPKDKIWLAPHIIIPMWLYWVIVITLFIVWMIYGILLNIRKDIVDAMSIRWR